ncbi:MAG: hypothetical protein HAW62_02450 [Endozoicomonadaceae bacterium]|nr:hypothetical protein [Endozoicomonadaceae bacterium]
MYSIKGNLIQMKESPTVVHAENQDNLSPSLLKRGCIEKKSLAHPSSRLSVHPARFESRQADRNKETIFSSSPQSLREHYSSAFKRHLTILDIRKDLENFNIISDEVLVCTQDDQSYALYENEKKHMIFLEKINNTYKIKHCFFNTDTQLFQLESQFELEITDIPEHIVNKSKAFQLINPMIEPENPFARQAFILDHLIKQDANITHQDIDDESYQVMLQALHYSGIRTLEEAGKYHLRLMAPGPVFTTWVSLKGTSIFNGENNPPRQIDFKSNLLDIANLLQPAGLPLIIVYAEYGMNPGEEDILISDFQHDNILIIKAEDLHAFPILSDKISYEKWKESRPSLFLMDFVRKVIIQDKTLFIHLMKAIARSQKKFRIAENLEKTEKGSLIYTDADNIFFRSPVYQVASMNHIQPVILKKLLFSINLKRCDTSYHISNILDINEPDLLENQTDYGRPVKVSITTTELKRQCYKISHALRSNVFAMNLAGTHNYTDLFVIDMGFFRTDHNSMPFCSSKDSTILKLAVIHQYAWLYIARTESWQDNEIIDIYS